MDPCQTGVGELAARHRRACSGFGLVVHAVDPAAWDAPTPCTEWDAAALVEHVIGFHEFLLLRPAGAHAHRPRHGTAARWDATVSAIDVLLDDPARLALPADYFDGGARRPGDVLDALTGDVLVHTWDLARTVGADDRLDPELSEAAYRSALAAPAEARRASGLFAAEVPVPGDADVTARLVGLLGRDPGWRPDRPRR
jgi:uncharacterized protein (TIGR03086 family)